MLIWTIDDENEKYKIRYTLFWFFDATNVNDMTTKTKPTTLYNLVKTIHSKSNKQTNEGVCTCMYYYFCNSSSNVKGGSCKWMNELNWKNGKEMFIILNKVFDNNKEHNNRSDT